MVQREGKGKGDCCGGSERYDLRRKREGRRTMGRNGNEDGRMCICMLVWSEGQRMGE